MLIVDEIVSQARHNSAEFRAKLAFMLDFLSRVSTKPMVLKGGTALLLCYGLDRPSFDLDFDGWERLKLDSVIKATPGIKSFVKHKDTETVLRYKVKLDADPSGKPLKIEVSFRETKPEVMSEVNGIRVHGIRHLISQKILALSKRGAARDLFDVIFLAERYHDDFSDAEKDMLRKLYESLDQTFASFHEAFDEDPLLRGRFQEVLYRLEKLYWTRLASHVQQAAERFIRDRDAPEEDLHL